VIIDGVTPDRRIMTMAMKVLVVDDSQIVRNLHGFMLHGAGYEIHEAENGSDAIEQLLRTKFDLIVTDINMPQMDGYELTRKVREIDGYKETPIVIVSTESEASDKSKGFEAGANMYIVKPVKPEELVMNAQMLVQG